MRVDKRRLEAFSDGVLAIILTIMVLELHVPKDQVQLPGLIPVLPVFASYVLSEEQGPSSIVARAIGDDVKGKISLGTYAVAIPLAYVSQWIAGALYVSVALMWVVPDRRLARALADRAEAG